VTGYRLYYWPIPFRGEFVRVLLTHAGASWEEADFDAIVAEKGADPEAQAVPHMAPPLLIDLTADIAIAQLPAILAYLGRKHGLIPADPAREALTHKVVADANDVLYEITLHNGAQMWTAAEWAEFEPRLARWMRLFEALGRRHGRTAGAGTLLGTAEPGLADLTVYSLWGVMTAKLPALRPLLEATAPAIAGLSDRIARRPEQQALRARSDAAYGEEWCSGHIEASLRAVL